MVEIDRTPEVSLTLRLDLLHDLRVLFRFLIVAVVKDRAQDVPCRNKRFGMRFVFRVDRFPQEIDRFCRKALSVLLGEFFDLALKTFGNPPDQHIAHMCLRRLISLIS
jgi:hypothetical protein